MSCFDNLHRLESHRESDNAARWEGDNEEELIEFLCNDCEWEWQGDKDSKRCPECDSRDIEEA